MNKNNLAQNRGINQEHDSWKDDPFNLKGQFTDTKKMNNTQKLIRYAHELVSIYGEYNYSECELNLFDLSVTDQNELARLYIETTDRELTECVNGEDFSIDNDYTCALLAMLHNYCQETRDNFAEVTRRNIVLYYKKSLQNLLDEACMSYLHLINNEQELYSHVDRISGEVVWEKV